MADKQISPLVKNILEYGPLMAYFVTYFLIKDQQFNIGGTEYSGFMIVTAAFVPLLVLTTFLSWRLSGEISVMQVLTVVLVVVFGGLTVFLQDERFFKMKPTMIYLLFAGILGFGVLRGKSYLETVMGANLKMQPQGWMILTRRVIVFFVALAVLNEIIWRTQSTDTWVTFKTFGLSLALFAFLMAQFRVFAKYGIEDDKS